MPPPSVLKRKPGVSAGDGDASAKRVNSEEDFELVVFIGSIVLVP